MGKKFNASLSRKTYLLGISTNILISFLALCCLLFIQSSAFAAKPTKDAVNVGGIAGAVQYCEGNPRGIVIAIPGTSFSATSNRSGNFSLRNIPPGSYQLIATINGQRIGLLNNVGVVANQTTNVGTWPVCTNPDLDGDGVPGTNDADDSDKFTCMDSDGDGCDDCSVVGFVSPFNDGPDLNGDGICDAVECENCWDCDGQPCINGNCETTCTSDSDCCAPWICDSGKMVCLPPTQ